MKIWLENIVVYFRRLISKRKSDLLELKDLSKYSFEELRNLIFERYQNVSFKSISQNEIDSFYVTYETKKTRISILYQNDGKFISASKPVKLI